MVPMSNLPPISEVAFQRQVMEILKLHRWHVVHIPAVAVVRRGRIQHMTTYQGDGGLPDLIIARDGETHLVELKSDAGRLSSEQRKWLEASGGMLWRPRDWPEILKFARSGEREQVDFVQVDR